MTRLSRPHLSGGASFAVSLLLVLVLGCLGLWAGADAGRQAEAGHRADRLALQVTLGNLTGQSTLVAAAEMTDILSAQTRAGVRAWTAQAGDTGDVSRLRVTADGSRALSAGAALVSADGALVASYAPGGVLLPSPTDPGWTPLRAAVTSGRRTLPVSGVLHAGTVPVVAVAVPTRFDDGRNGLLIGLSDLRTSSLEHYVRSLVNADGRTGYVLDRRGLVVAGPALDEVGAPLRFPSVLAAVQRGGDGIRDVHEGSRTLVVSYAQAGDSGWSAVTLQDEARFLGPLHGAARRAQAALVLLLLFAGSSLVLLHRRREAVLRAVAVRDELTGTLNRRGWYEAAGRELDRAEREQQPRSLLFVDLDGLKGINDTLGHLQGDRAIVATARVLRECTRRGDVLGRLGGDEFVLLLADDVAAEVVRDCIDRSIDAYNAGSGERFELRVSTGCARWHPAEPCGLDELIRRADEDMYGDKKTRTLRHVGLLRTGDRSATPGPAAPQGTHPGRR